MGIELLHGVTQGAKYLVVAGISDNPNKSSVFGIYIEFRCLIMSTKPLVSSTRDTADKGFDIFPGRVEY